MELPHQDSQPWTTKLRVASVIPRLCVAGVDLLGGPCTAGTNCKFALHYITLDHFKEPGGFRNNAMDKLIPIVAVRILWHVHQRTAQPHVPKTIRHLAQTSDLKKYHLA